MPSKTFPVGLTDEQRAKFQRAADQAGKSLAAWMRETCELAADGHLALTPVPGLRVVTEPSERPVRSEKRFTGPDAKVKPRPTGKEK